MSPYTQGMTQFHARKLNWGRRDREGRKLRRIALLVFAASVFTTVIAAYFYFIANVASR